jgi:transcriptional regulator with XRE-family HTH domain
MNGDDLKRKRRELRMTQVELAQALTVNVSTVSRWERGLRSVPAHLALALEAIGLKREKIAAKKARRTARKRPA